LSTLLVASVSRDITSVVSEIFPAGLSPDSKDPSRSTAVIHHNADALRDAGCDPTEHRFFEKVNLSSSQERQQDAAKADKTPKVESVKSRCQSGENALRPKPAQRKFGAA
jgi:hypothetical protein